MSDARIPPGYQIERQEEFSRLREEIRFRLVETATHEEVTETVARNTRTSGWHVHPGNTTSRVSAKEARARAAALILAAEEVERRVAHHD